MIYWNQDPISAMHDDNPSPAATRPSDGLPDPDSVTAPPQVAAPETGKTHLGGIYVGPPVIRGALLNSFRDGIAANGMIALNETFAVAAAVALRASSMGIAMMSSLPMFIGSLGQFLMPAFADPAKGRKHYVLIGVRGQVLLLLLAAFAGWLPANLAPWAFIGLYAGAAISANLTGPFWVSWMGDLIPGSARGRHFAWRSVFFSWMYLTCSLTAGVISRRYGTANAPWILFFGVFGSAATLRYVSLRFMQLQYEPVSAMAHEAFNPLKFRPGRAFAKYCLATGLFQGAASMSGPFFAVWYLRDLHFNYLFISIALSLTVLGSITFAGFWGKLSDNLGSGRVLWISAFLVALVPLPYVFTGERFVLWACCFYSGATWGGYNLANFNHMLGVTEQRHRSHYLAFASLVVGLVGCGFSLSGGFLATRLPQIMEWRLQSLFLLSGCLRLTLAAVLYFLMRHDRAPAARDPMVIYMELPGFRTGAELIRTVFSGFRTR